MKTPLFSFIQSSIWMLSLFKWRLIQDAPKPARNLTSGTQNGDLCHPRQDHLVLTPTHC